MSADIDSHHIESRLGGLPLWVTRKEKKEKIQKERSKYKNISTRNQDFQGSSNSIDKPRVFGFKGFEFIDRSHHTAEVHDIFFGAHKSCRICRVRFSGQILILEKQGLSSPIHVRSCLIGSPVESCILINILLLIGSSRRMTLLRTEGETSIFLDSDDSERAWRRAIKV